MKRSLRVDEFVASPSGRWLAGASYLAWCAGSDFGGTVLWGRPTENEARQLLRIWDYDRALPGRFDVVSDLGRVTTVDSLPFELLARYVAGRRAEYDARVRRHALVRPAGLSGAAIAGFNALIEPHFPWRVVGSAAEAFAWIEHSDGAAVLSEVEALVAETRGIDATVAALRALLARRPLLDIAGSARELQLSARSLQRRLAEAGTSFRDQLTRARIESARALLERSDDKLDVVARRVGLASASQLARLFRRLDGESPSDYRRRHR